MIEKSSASVPSTSKQRPSLTKTAIPDSPDKFVDAVENLINSATPRKKKALAAKNILPSSERNAHYAIVKCSKELAAEDKNVKQKLILKLKRMPSKEVSKTNIASGLGVSRQALYKQSRHGKRTQICTEVKQIVKEFYYRMDVSTSMPNKRRAGSDSLYVLKDTKKKTFARFIEENPTIKIRGTAFWKLKPKNVKKCGAAKMFQCVCDICENISLVVQTIRASMICSNMEVPLLLNNQSGTDNMARSLAFATLCSKKVHNPKCLDRQCRDCGTKFVSDLLMEWAKDSNDFIQWYKWEMAQFNLKKKVIMRNTKVPKATSRTDLLSEFIQQLNSLGRHIFTEYSQTCSYHQCMKKTKTNELTVVIDFAENYTCLRQGEAQSAYYSRNQVTMHPMVITINQADSTIRDSVVVISDDLTHDSCAVSYFFDILLTHVGIHYSDCDTIHVWSDGCGSQYKSKHPFFNLSSNFNSNYKIIWNFYGSRHGKSSSDGETGVVKTFLHQEVKRSDVVLDNAKDVYRHLCQSDRHIVSGGSRRHFYFAEKENIAKLRVQLTEIKTLPGTRRLHQIVAGSKAGMVKFRNFCCYCGPDDDCGHISNDWKSYLFKGTFIND